MFLSSYTHSLDDKGRLTLPSKYRAELAEGVVISIGIDPCLWVLPLSKWQSLADRISAMSNANPEVRDFSRLMFANAMDAVPDRQGRVLLPTNLREYAKLDGESVIAGVNNRIEIWNPELWSKRMTDAKKDPEGLAKRLGSMGMEF